MTPENSLVPESTDDRRSNKFYLPALNFVIVLLMFNFPSALLIREGGGPGGTPVFLIVGFMMGQFTFYALLGGLLGDSWLDGLGLSWILCLFASVMLWVGGGANFFDASVGVFLCSIPATCFVASAPLLLCRWLMGWQLRPESIEPLPRIRSSIEDLILVPACIVSLFVFARVPLLNHVDMHGVNYGFTSSIGLVFSVICILFVIPLTFVAFRSTHELRWVAIWMVPPFFVTVIILLVSLMVVARSGGMPAEAIGMVIGSAMVASSIDTLGLYLLWFGGYRLVRRTTKARERTSLDESEPQEQDTQLTALRTRHRVYVLTIFCVAAMSNVIAFQYALKKTEQTFTNIEAQGGKLVRENGRVVGIHFGRTATRILAGSPNASVRSIAFEGTQLDRQFMNSLWMFQTLESIDVSRTEVDASLLMYWRPRCKIIVRKGQFSDIELSKMDLSRVVKVE